MSHHQNQPASTRRTGRALKITVTVVLLVVLLLVAAEVGLRAYMKSQIADRVENSATAQGIQLTGTPSVSIDRSPLLLGLVRGKVPGLTVDIPSSLSVDYEDSDRSRPVITGQPAATVTARDVDATGDDPLVGEFTVSSLLPPEYLLAVIQKSAAESGTATGAGDAAGLMGGLLQVTAVTPDADSGVLDIEISGGLATVSMSPTVTDGALSFDVADVKIFGLSLPEELTAGLADSLRQSVTSTDRLSITDAVVDAGGLNVRLSGNDLRINDITSEVDGITVGAVTPGGTGTGTGTDGTPAAV